MLQYFLKQFGYRELSIALLKDFLATLKATFKEDLRSEIFVELCGMAEIKHIQGTDISTYLDVHKVIEC